MLQGRRSRPWTRAACCALVAPSQTRECQQARDPDRQGRPQVVEDKGCDEEASSDDSHDRLFKPTTTPSEQKHPGQRPRQHPLRTSKQTPGGTPEKKPLVHQTDQNKAPRGHRPETFSAKRAGDEPEQEAAENHRDQAKREDTLHAGQARECEVLEGRSKVVSVVPRMILHCADSRKVLRDIEFVHPETASARRCEKSHKADERPCGRDPGRCPGWLLPKSR